MPRKPIEISSLFPYHVTNRSNNRDWFYIPIAEVWTIFTLILREAVNRYGTEIHALVLMSNHYHLFLSTPEGNLSAFMRYFQTETSRLIQKRSERINHIFGSRYKWSLLTSPSSVAYVYKYVLRNPVRAGIVERVQDYRYSSLTSLLALTNEFPQMERISPLWQGIPCSPDDRLRWLNLIPDPFCWVFLGYRSNPQLLNPLYFQKKCSRSSSI